MGNTPSGDYTVSVIIPTYNRKDVLVRAIRSVLEQTYPVEAIIVVDDMSEFDTAAYLREQGLGQARVIRNATNLGGAGSRNVGADAAQTPFIAFLDSDDYWLPEKLASQMRVFQAYPDTEMVYCNAKHIDAQGKPQNFTERTLYDSDLWEHLLSGWTQFPNTSSLVFRKASFDAVGKFDGALTSCQDHDLWMRVGQSGMRVRYVSERLYIITSDAAHRITRNYAKRANGVRAFLSKWQPIITKLKGKAFFRQFENRYLVSTLISFFFQALRERHAGSALRVYRAHFAFNPFFYRHLYRFLRTRLARSR